MITEQIPGYENPIQFMKALEAGSGTDSAAFTGGRALQFQSLHASVIHAAVNMREFKLMSMLPKVKVGSTVHEWTRRDEVGVNYGGVVDENGFSAEVNQTLQRLTATMKTISRKRGVTFQMAMANALEYDAKASEKKAGILDVMRVAEGLLFKGDSSVVPQEFDGLKATIPTTNVIDIRGKQISDTEGEEAIETGARIVRELGFSYADNLFGSPKVIQDLQNLIKDRTRYPIVTGQGKVFYNNIIDTYRTTFGDMSIHDDLFINDNELPVVSTLVGKPSVPVLGAITAAANASSQFAAGDAGTYYYKVQGLSNMGGGDVVTSAVVTVAAGESVTIPITTPAGVVPNGYAIYRSKKNATSADDCRLVSRIENTAYPAGTTVNFIDHNADLPGCHDVYILTLDPAYDALKWLSFIDISEFPLGTINQAVYAFLVIMVGALGNYVPKRHVRIKNVEPLGLSWY